MRISLAALYPGSLVFPGFPLAPTKIEKEARGEPGNEASMQACSTLVSQATPLCKAHVALAPQVELQLLEGMQQQNTRWTRHPAVCIVFKEFVQLNFIARKTCS